MNFERTLLTSSIFSSVKQNKIHAIIKFIYCTIAVEHSSITDHNMDTSFLPKIPLVLMKPKLIYVNLYLNNKDTSIINTDTQLGPFDVSIREVPVYCGL